MFGNDVICHTMCSISFIMVVRYFTKQCCLTLCLSVVSLLRFSLLLSHTCVHWNTCYIIPNLTNDTRINYLNVIVFFVLICWQTWTQRYCIEFHRLTWLEKTQKRVFVISGKFAIRLTICRCGCKPMILFNVRVMMSGWRLVLSLASNWYAYLFIACIIQ